jgi:hypothetical protein
VCTKHFRRLMGKRRASRRYAPWYELRPSGSQQLDSHVPNPHHLFTSSLFVVCRKNQDPLIKR